MVEFKQANLLQFIYNFSSKILAFLSEMLLQRQNNQRKISPHNHSLGVSICKSHSQENKDQFKALD